MTHFFFPSFSQLPSVQPLVFKICPLGLTPLMPLVLSFLQGLTNLIPGPLLIPLVLFLILLFPIVLDLE